MMERCFKRYFERIKKGNMGTRKAEFTIMELPKTETKPLVYDKDTAKMNQVVKNLNLKSDIARAFGSDDIFEMSKKMGYCQGYPQLYLIEMKTKQVIWHSCGFRQGFTKEIVEIIKTDR